MQQTSKYGDFLITTEVDVSNAGSIVVSVTIDKMAPANGPHVLNVMSKAQLPDAHETEKAAHKAGLEWGKAWISEHTR